MSQLHAHWHAQGAFLQLKPNPDSYVLSLVNPGSEFSLDLGWAQSLQISFWDITDFSKFRLQEKCAALLDSWGAQTLADLALTSHGSWPLRPPLSRDAIMIKKFILSAYQAQCHLIIHCEFGKSRSGACALLAQKMGFILEKIPQHPNPILLSLFEKK